MEGQKTNKKEETWKNEKKEVKSRQSWALEKKIKGKACNPFRRLLCTMVQNRKKYRNNTHLVIHRPTSKGVSEMRGREQMNEHSGVRKQNEQGGESERVTGASK